MSDGSAAVLAEVLLTGDAAKRCELLSTAFSGDPPLLLWSVCAAGRNSDFEPHCVDDVARWLAAHTLEALNREDAEGAEPESDARSDADRVAAGLQVADLAVRLAAKEGRRCVESSFLLGLLHYAGDWLAAVGNPPPDDDSTPLPCWLTKLGDTPAADAVRLAAGATTGDASLPDSAGIDLDACRAGAAEGRRRWLARVGGLGDWLPALRAKLARLEALENHFQQAFQTEKLEAMAEFAAGAGHEINNPLTVIAGRAQLLLSEETDPERRRALALISAQSKRVYEMIADMMLFARPPRPQPELIDLVHLVDQVIEEFSPHAAGRETALGRVGEAGRVEIEVDPTQLAVAIRAICQNALEAIGREGHIEIAVHRRDRDVEILISDDGPGIPPEVRRHLFDPYYSARQAGRGLGLGLSKAWRIVTNHGGRIQLDSRPEHGTVFSITLPRQQS